MCLFLAFRKKKTKKKKEHFCCFFFALCEKTTQQHIILLIFRIADGKRIVPSKNTDKRMILINEDVRQELLDQYPIILFDLAYSRHDNKLIFLHMNSYFYNLLGVADDFFAIDGTLAFQNLIHPDDLQRFTAIIENAVPYGLSSFETEIRWICCDSSILWTQIRGNIEILRGESRIHCCGENINVQKAMEQEAFLSEERFRIALTTTSIVIFDYDLQAKTYQSLIEADILLGLPRKMDNVPESIVKMGVIHPESVDDFYRVFHKISDGALFSSAIIRANRIGMDIWIRLSLTNILDHDGKSIRIIGFESDVTREMNAKLAFIRENQYRSALLSNALAAYEINFSKNRILKMEGDWLTRFQGQVFEKYSDAVNLIAETVIHSDDRKQYLKTYGWQSVIDAVHHGTTEIKLEHRRLNAANEMIWALSALYLFPDQIQNEVLGFFFVMDIQQQKNRELVLKRKSEYDSLTGLLNKEHTERLLQNFLTNQNSAEKHGLMVIDLDNFKRVNDTYGHQKGDMVLAEMGKLLYETFRSTDIIGRVGGDEFVVFLKNVTSMTKTVDLAKNLCSLVTSQIHTFDQNFSISSSVGISEFPEDGKTYEELFQKADIALYEAKRHGKNCVFRYDPLMADGSLLPNGIFCQ